MSVAGGQAFVIDVAASDAAGNVERAVSLAIANLDEVAPVITSGAIAPVIAHFPVGG